MRLLRTEPLISRGSFAASSEWTAIQREIADAVARVVWPPGADRFTIHPQSGKKRGEGNGVKPIKDACMVVLQDRYGWQLERRVQIGTGLGAGKIDAVRETRDGLFALEWETGNISSSHRSLNKMALGLIEYRIAGGALIVPSRALYKYLTDRIGNYRELEPYFPLWRHVLGGDGVLAIFEVEYDDTSNAVPRITKGTDGRALL